MTRSGHRRTHFGARLEPMPGNCGAERINGRPIFCETRIHSGAPHQRRLSVGHLTRPLRLTSSMDRRYQRRFTPTRLLHFAVLEDSTTNCNSAWRHCPQPPCTMPAHRLLYAHEPPSSGAAQSSADHLRNSWQRYQTMRISHSKRVQSISILHLAMHHAPSFHLPFASRKQTDMLSNSNFKHPKRLKSMPLRNTFGSVERKIEVEFILHVNKNVELAHDFFVRTDSN